MKARSGKVESHSITVILYKIKTIILYKIKTPVGEASRGLAF